MYLNEPLNLKEKLISESTYYDGKIVDNLNESKKA